MPQRDSLGYTFGVATVLCVVCSLAVSAAAVALRPAQDENKLLDRQRNILDAAGLALGEKGYPASQLPKEDVAKLYSRVEERLVNLERESTRRVSIPKDTTLVKRLRKRTLAVRSRTRNSTSAWIAARR